MTALVLDTSKETSFVALFNEEKCLHYTTCETKKFLPSFSALLAMLETENLTLDYLAVGIGPGSYTGTRSGMAFASSFAFAKQLSLITFFSPLAYLPNGDGLFTYLIEGKRDDYCMLQGKKSQTQILSFKTPCLVAKNQFHPHKETSGIVVHASSSSLNLSPLPAFVHNQWQQQKNTCCTEQATPHYLYNLPT